MLPHHTVAHSVKALQWYGRVVQVSELLHDLAMQQQKHIMEISNIITKTNNQIGQVIVDSYNQRQKRARPGA